jgi:hypothetical protein
VVAVPKATAKRLTEEERARLLAQKICVRCGQPFSYLESRPYTTSDGITKHFYYCVHEEWIGGKRKRTKHYCSSDEYVYVSKFQQDIGLTLRGALDRDRWLDYTINIVQTMVDRALEEPENLSLKINVVQGLLKINELVQRSLAELGVPTATQMTVIPEVPEPRASIRVVKLITTNAIEVTYAGKRLVVSIDNFREGCNANIFNPKLCQAFEVIQSSIKLSNKEGGG